MDYRGQTNTENVKAVIANTWSVPERPTALGLCIFAGGFSLGMEEAGFDVKGHLELTTCQLGIQASRQRWPVYVGDVVEWKRAMSEMITPDVLYANPPCVAYAGTGKHEGTMDSRMCFLRNVAYDTMMVQQPTIWVWELVTGIMSKDLAWLQAMSMRAAKLGYECHAFLTSSALHGGFQDRRRFHFVASKVKLDFEQSYLDCPPEWKGSRTLGEALALTDDARYELAAHRPGGAGASNGLGLLPNDQTTYRGAFSTLFEHTVPGMHLGHVPDEIMYKVYRPWGAPWTGKGRPGFSHTRGRLDRPCPNILGGHTVVHPVEDRYLTPRENATVMGFPTNFEFSEGSKAYAEIGRGLCTHNARFVGKAIKDGLANNQPANVERMGPLRVVDWRGRVRVNSLTPKIEEARAWYEARHSVPACAGYGKRPVVHSGDLCEAELSEEISDES